VFRFEKWVLTGVAIAAMIPLAPAQGQPAARPTAPAPVLRTMNFTKVNAGLYRGGRPMDADLKALVSLGIKTDICLLGDGKGDAPKVAHERSVARALGLKFVNIPLPHHAVPPTMIDAFFQTVLSSASQPVYVHCIHGRDRTGAMIALYRIRHDGYTGQQALAEMKRFGFNPRHFPEFTRTVLSAPRASLPAAPVGH